MQFTEFTEKSYTAYHATQNVISVLRENGFTELKQSEKWIVEKGKGYYTVADGSALIAFKAGGEIFNIVAAHTDSPCFKLKGNPEMKDGYYVRLNTETYGGGLYYTFLDRPLRIAGRLVTLSPDGKIKARNVVSDFAVTVPSLAIHMNREANKGLALNPQVDTLPLVAEGKDADIVKALAEKVCAENETVVESDLFVVSDTKPYTYGLNDEFLASPRLDDLCGIYGAITALIRSNGPSTAVAACLDNEEVGSSTKQGAGGTFLKHTLKRIAEALGFEDFRRSLASSFMVSTDNAHSFHPAHPEKNDPTVKPVMNGGIVVKHHGNQSYTTDAVSSAVIKTIFAKNDVRFQDFYNRSDSQSGGTLGAISSRQLSIRSVDIGLAQLAMHSACETIGSSDMTALENGLTAFYNAKISADGYDGMKIE